MDPLQVQTTNGTQKQQLPPPPPTTIDDLPTEVIQKEILPRLPIHSLFQTRYVCTKWRCLINDPRFAKLHYSYISQNPTPNPTTLILLDWGWNEVYYISDLETTQEAIRLARFPVEAINEDRFPWEIVGCVNGLTCFRLDHEQNFIIFNPVNGDFTRVPFTTPCSHIFHNGFGWDKKTNKYKLMVIQNQVELQVQIHTLGGSNTWRSIGTVPCNIPWNADYGFFLNGSLHWIMIQHHLEDQTVVGIRAVNVDGESLGMVSVPRQIKGKIDHQFLQLGVFQGCLMIAESSLKDLLRVWIMKDYGVDESWVLEFLIPMPSKYKRMKPLGVLRNGNVLLACDTLRPHDFNEFSSYDPNTKMLELLRVNGLPDGFWPFCHVGSLVTLKDVIEE